MDRLDYLFLLCVADAESAERLTGTAIWANLAVIYAGD